MRLVSFRRGGGDGDGDGVGELRDDGSIAELAAASMIDWLAGNGRAHTDTIHDPAGLRILAPVPEPPSLRDFFAYEGHVAAGFRHRGSTIPEAWYEAPAFYFSNPAAIVGPEQPVRRPAGCVALDFELEIAAVIGAGDEIAGFTLMNDWSARDLQAREMTVGLGPAKAKDFATSLGPWLVTPDELPYQGGRLELTATVTVNDHPLSEVRCGTMHFTWPDLVAHAARETRLRPGDVLGSGTVTGGCLLELGPIDGHWIEPGDTVRLAAPELGELRTPVVG